MAVSEKTTLRHQKWKREILDIIRNTPNASRILVKRKSALSMDSTLSLVEELIDEGLVLSVGKSDSGKAGRKATLLEINPNGAYFIGVRFSAAGISGALMNFACETVNTYRLEFAAPPEEESLVSGILACIQALIDQLGEKSSLLLGIGLGAPGIIDLKQGTIVRYVHIPGIHSLPLRQIVEDRFHIPVYLEHGVKCSARAALSKSEAVSGRDLLFMQTGRGIHLCVIIDGQIHTGMHYLSGEIGHMQLASGRTLEETTSSSSLCQFARAALERKDPQFARLADMAGDHMTLEDIIRAADLGCRGSTSLLMQAGEAAGNALSAAIMIVNPSDILLNGTLCASSHFELAVRQTLHARCIPESMSGVTLRFIASDPRQDASGAAMIPFHMQFGMNDN
ncbi:MAG: ROK family protein [Clostridia bacterium]|nr:ROK family protein [Clostridia bacterium]